MVQGTPNGAARAALLMDLFTTLAGRWKLNRKLHSTDKSEPSGLCDGEARFTQRAPSPVVDADGKLHLADSELLYEEQGEFEMTPTTSGLAHIPKFSFSRKYVWRLQKGEQAHTISVWFTKPGTDTVDYLFHKIDIPVDDTLAQSSDKISLHGTGGHLCVEDFYNSSYDFTLSKQQSEGVAQLASWTTLHEVRGPKKDQLIYTHYAPA